MSADKLSRISQHMATVSFIFLIGIILLNSFFWIFPGLSFIDGGYGLSFSLTNSLISDVGINVESLPRWQIAGGAILSGIPLLALSYGLNSLRLLFKGYVQREYFSKKSASLLSCVGKSIILWEFLSFVIEPMLSYWMTFREGPGNRIISLSFEFKDVFAIFVAFSIILISQILRRAADLQDENRQFV